MDASTEPRPPGREAEETRTRRALLHMLEELQRERNALRIARRGWLETVDAFALPLVVLDASLRILRANGAYAKRAGMAFPELIGRPYWECFPRRGAPAAMPAQVELESGELFLTRSFPIGEADGQGPATLHLFEDVTERRRTDEQVRAVAEVAGARAIQEGDVEAVARQITETAVRVTGVARANVWLFNAAEDELRCIDLYEAASGAHSAGMVLREQEFASEFAALKRAPYIDANDALTDPRCAGYLETYVKPLGITSMLDTVVHVSGRHIGVLCLEHVARPHRWQPDEIAFAARLADKVAVALSNRSARQAEAALRESERRLRILFEKAPVGISESSLDGRYLRVNRRLCDITGYSEEELRARSFREITHPDDLARDEHALARLLAGEIAVHAVEKRYLRKDGSVVWVALTVTPVGDASGAIEHLVTIVEDIGERKAAAEALRESEEKHRVLIASSRDAFLTLAPPGWTFESGNPAAVAMFGASGEAELRAKGPAELSPARQPDGRLSEEKAQEMIAIAMREGNHAFEWRHRRLGGEEFPATVLLTRLELKGRTLLNATVRDVTELHRAHEEVQRRERYFRKLIEGSADAFFVIEHSGKLVHRSESALELTGYRTGEKMGQDITSIVLPEDVPAARRAIAQLLADPAKPVRAELRVLRRDGSVLEVETVGRNLLGDEDVKGIVVTARDVTQRKRADAVLRKTNRALRTLSACNEALVRASDEPSLLKEMTRVVTQLGGYPIAAVGYALDDAEKSVALMAVAGLEEQELRQGPLLSWADGERGQSAIGRAIRLGATQMIRDIAADPGLTPWGGMLRAKSIGSAIGLPLRGADGRAFGALGIAAPQVDGFDAEEVKLLEELAADLAYGIANLRAGVERRAAGEKLRRSLESTIEAIAATMETRDPYTAGHQRRVATLAAAIAVEMGLPARTVEGIHFGALIHDLGKIQVPAEILAKPTRLTKLEFELIKVHAQAGYDIIKGVDFPWPVALMVLQHHERIDGSGYPQGLKGEQMIPEARILAVADVVEAMSSHRPYRPGLGIEVALKEIEAKRGTWFEPAAVDACLRLFREQGFAFSDAKTT